MNREIRYDTVSANRTTTAALLLCAAMLGMTGVLVWIFRTDGNEPVNPPQRLGFLVGLLALFAATVNVFVSCAKVLRFYRCPQCGARVPRVPGTDAVGSRIRYDCAACGVEWDTGWTVAPPD